MDPVSQFIWFLITMIATQLIAPVPKLPSAPAEKPKYPTASEDAVQVWGAGTFLVPGNIIWEGDDMRVEQSRDVKVNWFKKAKQTYGWKYYHGFWYSLTAAPVHELRAIRVGDRTVWSGSKVLSRTEPTEVPVHANWFTAEGQEVPDGLSGAFIFYNQTIDEDDDTTPMLPMPYLAGQLNGIDNVPGYPNRCHAVWLGPSSGAGNGFVGNSRQLAGIQFVLRKRTDLSAAFPPGRTINLPHAKAGSAAYGFTGEVASEAGQEWLSAFLDVYGDIAGDNNPAFELLELLTTRVPGVGPKLSPWAVDIESFLAAAPLLYDESNGVSFTWDSTRARDELLGDILAQIQGTLEMNERTGQVSLKLMRDYIKDVRARFDDSNIIELRSFSRVQSDSAPNEVQISFNDRNAGWKNRPAKKQNAAGINAAGRVITLQRSYIGCSRWELATMLADRDVRISSAGLARVEFDGWVTAGQVLKPGDLIEVELTDYAQTVFMRVNSCRFGEFGADRRLRVSIEAMEDLYFLGQSSQEGAVIAPEDDFGTPPASVVNASAAPAPYALTGRADDVLLYYAEDPGASTTSYRLATQEGVTAWTPGVPVAYLEEAVEPALSCTLTADLGSGEADTTLSLQLSPAGLDQWRRASRGAVFVLLGNEWARCSEWALSGDLLVGAGVQRGCFDTVPQALPAGSIAKLLLGYALDESSIETNYGFGASGAGPTNVVLRAESRGPGGLLDPSSPEAAASEVAWSYDGVPSRAALPLLPGLIRLNGALGQLHDANNAPALSRADSAQLTWANRNRLARRVAPYYTPSDDNEPGAFVRAWLQVQDDNGGWQQFTTVGLVNVGQPSWQSANPGDSSMAFDLSEAPAGPRLVRVRLLVLRPSGAATLESSELWLYWRLAS